MEKDMYNNDRAGNEAVEIKVSEVRHHKVIEVPDNVCIYNVNEFKSMLFKELESGHKSVVINLKNVNRFDSSFLGALVHALKKMKDRKGELSLLNITEEVWTVLKLTNLEKIFKIYNDEEEL